MSALSQRLAEVGPELGRRVMREIYADPFWVARFGDRGVRHSNQDADFHVTYLVQALLADDVEILNRYARWLRTVLVTRGMCTLHLSDNFVQMASAIEREVEGSEQACRYLHSACESLLYSPGPARDLQDFDDALASGAAHDWPGIAPRQILRSLISFLADAVAAKRPELFVSHAVWLESFLGLRVETPPSMTSARTVSALAAELERSETLSAETKRVASEFLEKVP